MVFLCSLTYLVTTLKNLFENTGVDIVYYPYCNKDNIFLFLSNPMSIAAITIMIVRTNIGGNILSIYIICTFYVR